VSARHVLLLHFLELGKIRRSAAREDKVRKAKTIAIFLATIPAGAMAANEAPKFSAEQIACAAAAAKEYLTANAAFILKATANGAAIMSIDDAIAQRRLVEDYCRRHAACLSSNVKDAGLRETILRGTFAGCISDEAKEGDGDKDD
jgi:hypothetical protein